MQVRLQCFRPRRRATGGLINHDVSGLFNTGITGPVIGFPSGEISGDVSGFGNTGAALRGRL